MGCGPSSPVQLAADNTKEIDQQLEIDRSHAIKEARILLLGAGEGGKSTIVKQMRIIHGSGYSQGDRIHYRSIVYSNTIQSFFAILEAMEKIGVRFKDSGRLKDVTILTELIQNLDEQRINKEIGDVMIRLWKDEAVQYTFWRSREYQLNDSAGYFLNSLTRISSTYYIPSEQDVLKTRVHTSGVNETSFSCKGWEFRMIDVGGQKSQRKKWLHCFDEVSAIIFCASLSEYDLLLEEDGKTNRMVESMNLYKNVCQIRWFLNKRIILFLNKTDLLAEKVQISPLKNYFPEYEGLNTYEDAVFYIKKKFISLGRTSKETYTHLTCATDTRSIQWVFDAVADVIIKLNQEECGIY